MFFSKKTTKIYFKVLNYTSLKLDAAEIDNGTENQPDNTTKNSPGIFIVVSCLHLFE